MTAFIAFVYYWRVARIDSTGDYNVKVGNYRIADGVYDQAIDEFKTAMELNPENASADLGMALAYIQKNDLKQAFKWLNSAISKDKNLAPAFANRAVLHDRLGDYEKALEDYKQAIRLDPDIMEGPGKIHRFLNNITEKPPTIYDRALYIKEQLMLPEEERLLKVVSEDEKQKMYKYKQKVER
jgi:tetratricopeptide (TPR) repeat protein